ncbi:ATP-binding protein [Flavobacteriaceae bacterium S0862]|nr:ATP-binding protein [Flavobacteriaceae bacterium S0862]
MKLTKKQEKEIWQVYDTWLNSYLNGDVKTYDSFLDDDYHFIGSATKEEFLNRKDTTKFFADTGDQFAGKTEIRNESKIIEQFGELIFITHVLDAWFLHEKEWNFYSRFRFSSILRKNKDGWRFIYQHFSIPDPKTAEGETIGYDKINEENQELREAIQRRTIELEQKNRELEVETALERIRAQAVAMKESKDLLDIVVSMRNEFIKLGHEAHYFWQMMWLPKTYEKAMTSGDGSKIGFVMKLPRHIHGDIPLLAKWEKSKNPTVVYAMNVDEAIDYVDKMVTLGDFQNIDPQAPTHDDIRHIGGLTFIMARTTHGEIGFSLPGIVKNPPKEDIDILVKFAGAFDLAHQRFLDLQKAEKQARETQIELGLEKVRSRTMAMQHSYELQEASFLLDEQVRALGIKTWGCAFNIYGENESTEWFGNEAGVLPTYTVPHKGIFKEYYQKGQKGESFFIKEFSGKTCVNHYEYMSSLPVIGDVLKNLKKTNNGFPTYQLDHVAYFKYGYLLFITKEHVQDAHDIFKRFAKVFQQTYTRFLDLQKAEKQAREAQIEVAMERIRSRSLAMHTSEELMDVITELRRQIDDLGQLDLEASVIHLYTDGEPMFESIAAVRPPGESGEIVLANVFFPVDATNQIKHMIKMYASDATEYTIEFEKEMAEEWQKTMMKYAPTIAERRIGFVKNRRISEHSEYWNFADFSDGSLLLVTHSPASEDTKEVLRKAAQVFDLAYRRYKDLKRAEAQARKAQIEAALEKIRSRTMAMQGSDELEEVVVLLYKELIKLNVTNFVSCGYVEVNEETERQLTWVTNPGGDSMALFYLPLKGDATFDKRYNAWKAKQTVFHQTVAGKKRKDHLEFAITTFQSKEAEEMVRNQFPDPTIFYCFNFSHGYLHLVCGSTLTKQEEALLARFTKVFEQTYARFLDLQKAETQAREAQIEAALERVRSQSMRMQSTDELSETTQVFHEQLELLGIDSEFSYLWLPSEDEKKHLFWATWSEREKRKTSYQNKSVTYPLDKSDPEIEACYIAWESGETVHVNSVASDKVEDYFNTWQELLKGVDKFKPELFPNGLFYIDAYMDYGCFGIMIKRELNTDEKNILSRFSKEFQRTYTRFLGLQKAEAQARTSQINLAVERVRAKALAMHKSEEILNLVAKLKEELMALDIPNIVAATIFLEAENDQIRMWDLSTLQDSGGDFQIPFDITFKLKKNDPHLYQKRVWENKKDYFIETQDEKGFERITEWLEEHGQSDLAQEVREFTKNTNLKILYHAVKKLNKGKLSIDLLNPPSEEMQDILTKMGTAFDLAYKRFEDLQKAEKQAREAQIEGALERLRGASMAMHNTEDLYNVVVVYFDQLKKLNIDFVQSWITIFHLDKGYVDVWFSPVEGIYDQPTHFKMPSALFEDTSIKSWKEGLPFSYISLISKEEVDQFLTVCDEVMSSNYFMTAQKKMKWNKLEFLDANNKYGCISKSNLVKASIEDKEIIQRFSKVFEQTYTRFLDLQKAEAQSREAHIEASLERVRAASMAMHKSDELKEVINVIFDQMAQLKINAEHAGIVVDYEPKKDFHFWVADTQNIPAKITVPYLGLVWDKQFTEAKKKNKEFFTTQLDFEEKNSFYKKLLPHIKGLTKKAKDFYLSCPGLSASTVIQKDIGLYIENFSGIPFSEEDNLILKRFGKVFQQSYTRFLDLQKAESQAREAQIEASLERVRARAMAMHQTDELTDVLGVLFDQFELLGINPALTHLTLFDEANETFSLRITTSGKKRIIAEQIIDVDTIEAWRSSYKNWQKSELHALDLIDYKAEDLPLLWEVLDEVMSALPNENKIYPEDFPNGLYTTQGHCKFGYLGLNSERKATEEEKEIVVKFAKEFGRLYQRFLDLQKAEAQVIEAQIEAALEKVRSRTMAMQKSTELPEAANNLFLQVQELGIPAWSAGYCIWQDDKHNASCNMSSEGQVQKGFILPSIGEGYDFYTPQEDGEHFYVKELGGEALVKHYEFMRTLPIVGEIFDDFAKKGIELPTFQIFHIVYFKFGYVMFITYEAVPDSHDVFKRFGNVFEQTYTRFLDLKRAEAQAREAQIEAALERVRSQSMGMQSTNDFAQVTTEMFNQLRNFGEDLFATGIVFCDKHKGHVEQWHSIPRGGMLSPMIVPIDLDYIHQYRYDQWKKGTELFSIEIPSDFIEQHFEDIFKLPSAQITLKDLESRNAPMPETPPWEIDYGASFKNGYILASSLKPLENMDILPRFAKVFEQAYTRYLDLQKAENRAREAQIEMALEKVRSRTMTMEYSSELAETSVVVFKELLNLGIAPNRLFIGIIKDNGNLIDAWATNEDGSKIESRFTLQVSKNKSIKKMVAGWKQHKKSVIIDLKGKELQDYFRYLNEEMKVPFIDGLKQKRRVQTVAYFSGGLIGMAASEEQPQETTDLLERFASVFNLTYTRFNDLKIAEKQAKQAEEDLINLQKAKKRAEQALSELQSTQKQLIQSEKMASLGELTAGIAHEIQNPLNFVNNFSEVSKELLDEMIEELENGDMEEVKAITDDVIQNLEKINHHGKRADSIVKGMLQHSRATGDKKEPTNINALADEYLRLAYHGLRAKDKSFNATLVTDFDENIGNINILPQDIGRVVLNLLTNAFYVVNEKKQSNKNDYEPTVSISTKKNGNWISISVKDNGNGIPKKVLDKIFQPFFTTKPTGQGTGLGLSMSYDIITKGHEGELKVNTQQNRGTEFIIKLPI